MDAKDTRRPDKSIVRPQGYSRHYITFFRYFDSEELRYRVDAEPPTDTELYEYSETHEVVTSLTPEDFFDSTLFRNTHAVVRWTKHVGRLVENAA